jgi:hypothetical protein
MQWGVRPLSFARLMAGNSSDARIEMMTMTTSNSIKVNAALFRDTPQIMSNVLLRSVRASSSCISVM